MQIRTAAELDVAYLRDIYNYEVEHGTATFDIDPRSMEDRMVWFQEHNQGNHPLLVAEMDGRAVGYASLSAYRSKEAYDATVELSLYVDPAYRRRGIARRLMEAILAEARARNDIHTVISVITRGNEASIALHEEFGFVYSGVLKEVGIKFGKYLDVVNYQLLLAGHG